MPKQISFRGILELDDGSFRRTENILQSPELQRRCVEQRELKKIIRLFEKHNLDPANLAYAPQFGRGHGREELGDSFNASTSQNPPA